MKRAIEQYPHCDSRVLHAPGECEYCDEHADWQELRQTWGINFTGHHDPAKLICPAQRERPLDSIHAWGGNAPETPDRKEARDRAATPIPEPSYEIPAKGERIVPGPTKVDPVEFLRQIRDWLKGDGSLAGANPTGPLASWLKVDPPAEKAAEPAPLVEKAEQESWPTKPKATLSGRPPELPHDAPAPAPIDPNTGMHRDYWVLPESERAKGFVRPYRDSYRHVGERPKYPLRDLTAEEKEQGDKYGYVKYEEYPESMRPLLGRSWSKKDLDRRGCGTVTTMGRALSETYARDPKYYGATFCCGCGKHFPVAEFVWTADGEIVGS
jgi:hypothetical protein